MTHKTIPARSLVINDNGEGYTHVATVAATNLTINIPAWARNARELKIKSHIKCSHTGAIEVRLRPNANTADMKGGRTIGTAAGATATGGNDNVTYLALNTTGGANTAIKFSGTLWPRDGDKWSWEGKFSVCYDDAGTERLQTFGPTFGHKDGAWEQITSIEFFTGTTDLIGVGSWWTIEAVDP